MDGIKTILYYSSWYTVDKTILSFKVHGILKFMEFMVCFFFDSFETIGFPVPDQNNFIMKKIDYNFGKSTYKTGKNCVLFSTKSLFH